MFDAGNNELLFGACLSRRLAPSMWIESAATWVPNQEGSDRMPNGGDLFLHVKKSLQKIRLEIEAIDRTVPAEKLTPKVRAPYPAEGNTTDWSLVLGRRIVEDHGGELQVYSALNLRTLIGVRLPVRYLLLIPGS